MSFESGSEQKLAYRLIWNILVFRTLPSQSVDVSIEWQFWIYEYINELLKPDLKLGKASLNETPTLKLGLTPVMTVPQGLRFC